MEESEDKQSTKQDGIGLAHLMRLKSQKECVGGHDDIDMTRDFNARFTWLSHADQAYYVVVHGYAGCTGPYKLCMETSEEYPSFTALQR